MEKFWDAVAKILPILTFYPGWAKAIFLTTFACFLVSVFVFITLYPAATRQQKAVEVATTVEEPPSDVRISIEQTDGTLTKLYADLGAGLTDLYSSATSLR